MSAKFRKQGNESKRNFVAKFRAGWTKFLVIRKFRSFASTKRNFVQVERNFECRNEILSKFQEFVADYKIQL